MYADYEDNEVGSLDGEEIEGHLLETSPALLQCLEQFEKNKKEKSYCLKDIDKENVKNCDGIKYTKEEHVEDNNNEDTESSDTEYIYLPVDEKKKHDCASILSTYSNLYNHPKLILEPKAVNQPNRKVNTFIHTSKVSFFFLTRSNFC